jgi:hypothetical protein
MDAISAQLIALGANVPEATIPTNEQLGDRVAALEDAQRRMASVQRDQGVALGQIAARDEAGDYHWRFNANSQPARQEFSRAIARTAPDYGQLIIHNRTNSGQWVIVNGFQEYINAGAKEEFDVKPGTVSTRLPGQQPINWMIGLPNYRQYVDINPGTALPVARRIIYSQPTYIDSWVAAY